MSKPPPHHRDASNEDEEPVSTSPEEKTVKNRIVILQERDIPFQEERPPNLSPNFEVKVYRVKARKGEEDKE